MHVWLIHRGHLLGEPSEELLRLGDCGVADPRLLRQPPVANYDDKHPLYVAPYVCHMVHAGSPRERSYREAPHDEILAVGRGQHLKMKTTGGDIKYTNYFFLNVDAM